MKGDAGGERRRKGRETTRGAGWLGCRAAAVGRRGACARGGLAVGAQGAGPVSGVGFLGGPRGDFDFGRGLDLPVRRDVDAFRNCLGWGSESDARSESTGGEAGACRRDGLLLARGTHSRAPAWLCSCSAFGGDS